MKILLKNNIKMSILFYEKNQPYYEFSNFYEVEVTYNGIVYPTSEHAYQAAKFLGNTQEEQEYMDIIRKANTPGIARILALQKTGGGYKWRTNLNPIITKYKELGVTIRPDWEDVKTEIMANIVICKFEQHQDLKELLVSTGDRHIAEHTSRDLYWGDGGEKGNGESLLGQILMALRQDFIIEGI